MCRITRLQEFIYRFLEMRKYYPHARNALVKDSHWSWFPSIWKNLLIFGSPHESKNKLQEVQLGSGYWADVGHHSLISFPGSGQPSGEWHFAYWTLQKLIIILQQYYWHNNIYNHMFLKITSSIIYGEQLQTLEMLMLSEYN